MSAASQVDPHDKMRARDVNRVARGEQAPRPAHEYGSIKSVPSPPPPSSAPTIKDHGEIEVYQGRRQGRTPKCERFENYKSLCPVEWIERWDEEQKLGVFAGAV